MHYTWNGLLTAFPQSTEWKSIETVSFFFLGLTQSQHKDIYLVHIATVDQLSSFR